MPFQLGNKLAKGGARPNPGRTSGREIIALEHARARILRHISKDIEEIWTAYKGHLIDDAATARHALDRVLALGAPSDASGAKPFVLPIIIQPRAEEIVIETDGPKQLENRADSVRFDFCGKQGPGE